MGRQRKKSKTSPQKPQSAADGLENKVVANGTKSVSFGTPPSQSEYIKPSGSGMKPSPSVGTLNRLDRETYVLWYRPLWTILYCFMEVLHLIREFVHSLVTHKSLVALAMAAMSGLYYVYLMQGPHQEHIRVVEKHLVWCLYWVGLGVLSSVGFGTGLHTFLIYLGPHIARVTLAAYECNSLDFPEPPYPDDVTCPTTATSSSVVSLLAIISKVRLESLMWGAGTALGELPPYFMARTARLSGETPDDEEYREFLALMEGDRPKEASVMERLKIWMEEKIVKNISFFTILVFASVPNPFFDLAGITCGHFLVPFWTFFGATLIGKALVKMHVQMLFVVLAFSEHHVETLVNQLKRIPKVGVFLQAPLKEFLRAQKLRFHRNPGDPVPAQASSVLQTVMTFVVSGMILWFVISILNSLAQRYHKRRCDSQLKKVH